MKVIIFGKEKEKIESLVTKNGFEIVAENPDFVVSYGGDGTLMAAEAAFPGLPKIVLKNSLICKKCSSFSNETVLEKVLAGEYEVESLIKLVAKIGGKKLLGMNDIVVHNQNSRHALRYKVAVNGKNIGHEVIGDGVVVATPFGSTAYFRSITDSFFEVGIGLAFNNSIEQADHMILKDNSIIEIFVTRGPASVYADNQTEEIIVNAGDKVIIQKSEELAKVVRITDAGK